MMSTSWRHGHMTVCDIEGRGDVTADSELSFYPYWRACAESLRPCTEIDWCNSTAIAYAEFSGCHHDRQLLSRSRTADAHSRGTSQEIKALLHSCSIRYWPVLRASWLWTVFSIVLLVEPPTVAKNQAPSPHSCQSLYDGHPNIGWTIIGLKLISTFMIQCTI